MAPERQDRVQREIEELLDRLDNFVPEERLVSKIKKRRREASGPNVVERAWNGVRGRFAKVTLGHVMLLGILLMLSAWIVPGLFFGFATFATIAGLALTVGTFILSFLGWDSRRTIAGGPVEKRWRGQVISYSQPKGANRIRDWFRRGRR